ncbi:MAG TPA: hypothetical protein VGP87_15770 [Gemmatimonadales bacterium]|nr:hypothetical protein [Gemmatimonadales bacterium]
MSGRTFESGGEEWMVSSTGRITQYGKDEFGLRFTRLAPAPREERVVRYSPQLSKSRESALAQLNDADLAGLLKVSQPSWTAPDTGYRS